MDNNLIIQFAQFLGELVYDLLTFVQVAKLLF